MPTEINFKTAPVGTIRQRRTAAVLNIEDRIRVPIEALTFDGFNEWMYSGNIPVGCKASFLNGEVHLELDTDPPDESLRTLERYQNRTGAFISIDEWLFIPAEAFTFDGFVRWMYSDDAPPGGRSAFLGDEVYLDISPEELNTHARVKGDIYAFLWQIVRREKLGDLWPDRVLVVNDESSMSQEPDMVFCSRESLESGRVRYLSRSANPRRLMEVNGSPDLVMEIVSRNSVSKYTSLLMLRYHAAGIREYWLVDAREDELLFDLHFHAEGGYVVSIPDADGFRFSPVLNRTVRLIRTFNEFGMFDYALEEGGQAESEP